MNRLERLAQATVIDSTLELEREYRLPTEVREGLPTNATRSLKLDA
jgi:hypothetical protein